MAVDLAHEYRDVVEEVALRLGVPVELIVELLGLEARHSNLHAWGARPALRRELSAIVDRAIAAGVVGPGRGR